MNKYLLRKAKLSDVPQLYNLINYYANRKLMLARALSELYEHIQEFFVIELHGKVVACCALHVSWKNLAEIRSLAVKPGYTHKRYGSTLLKECETEAKKLGVKKLFVLSFVPGFFKRHGYKKINRNKLPHKIWAECIKCPLFPDCKEIPLIKSI